MPGDQYQQTGEDAGVADGQGGFERVQPGAYRAACFDGGRRAHGVWGIAHRFFVSGGIGIRTFGH